MELDEYQQIAVDRCCDMSLENRIVPVTGPAGTGKTTIIKQVYDTIFGAGYSVVLCAPTGKAAKRIFEATGIPAMTIHRLLEYPFPGERDEKTGKAMDQGSPKRNAKNPIDYHVVIADEYAMVNLEVHSNLVFALPKGGRLLMFGDVNQLKPIEKSRLVKESPFEQGIRRFNGVYLEKIHRHDEGSGIAENGALILHGRVPKRRDDFKLMVSNSPVKALEDHLHEHSHNGETVDFAALDNQIISSTRKSWVGTYKLNLLLQDLLNPSRKVDRLSLPRHKWEEKNPIFITVGDKVIWTENSYDLRSEYDRYTEDNQYIFPPIECSIMNGESGKVIEITELGDVTIDLGDREVFVPHSIVIKHPKRGYINIDPRKLIDLAYCITTHKAQGSEYKNVVYIMNKSTYFMQCRSNLYTGISRARHHVTLITDQRSLMNSVIRERTILEEKRK